ncbi:Cytochrome P450 [Penicillium italicum]|uniref:Cytochrome P450 n=1 Tax=Penicillium italicum TaxID=40296 RepID=A0A0A2L3G2_PENIT|nr:Cytochrome P450 [Penicillium italicum]
MVWLTPAQLRPRLTFLGPVIRTHPNEIHVFDRTAYDQIYRVGTEFDKCQNFYDHPLGEGSHFNMPDLKSSKLRRDMFASALSRAAVQKAEPRLRDTVLRFIQVLRRSAEMNDVVDMTAAFHSLTTDAIMHFAWGINFGAIDTKDFNFPTIERMNYFLVGAVILRTFHSIMRPFFTFAFRFPLIAKFNSTFRAAHWLRESCNRIVENSVAKSNIDDIGLFSSALKQHRESGLPNVRELTSEAIVFLVGGEESSANTLIHELHQAIPQEETLPSVATLEKIPFLTAVVKESLRFSHGAPGRLPRVVPNQGALLCGYSIPKEVKNALL